MSKNQELFDKTIRRRIFIERLSLKEARELEAFLNEARIDLEKQIRRYDGANLRREIVLRRQLTHLDEMIADVYGRLNKELRKKQKALSAAEAKWNGEKLTGLVEARVEGVTGAQVYGAMRSQPVHGLLVPKMVRNLPARQKDRLAQALRISYIEGESASQTISRVRDITKQNRRGLELLVRTVNGHIATQAQRVHTKANKHLYDRYRWTSILDRRTTPVCRSRDGRIWPISPEGEHLGPLPPAHMMCRSSYVDLLRGDEDPEHFGYDEWLRTQKAPVQDEILGPARGKLFRQGKFNSQTFVDNKGKLIRLDELAK